MGHGNNAFVGSLFGTGGRRNQPQAVGFEEHPLVNGQTAQHWYLELQKAQQQIAELVADRDRYAAIAIERKAITAGLKAVIREALKVLRETDPKHPLLDKNYRDRLYRQFEQDQLEKSIKANTDFPGVVAEVDRNPGAAPRNQ